MARYLVGTLMFVALVTAPLQAQGNQRPTCEAPEHRQFDFWIGEWEVFNPNGQQVGTNRVEVIEDGCALQENWESAGGNTGRSFNIYDRTRGVWHQTWVSDSGTLLLIEGGLEDGAMVMEGTTKSPNGVTALNRITWTPLDDGSVQQHWERSTDGGETWSTAFNGNYRKAS